MAAAHDPRSLVERVSAISVLGDPVAREACGLNRDSLVAVITPLATFAPSENGLVLTEVVAGLGVDALAERTGFPIRAADDVAERPPLTEDEARVLAELRAAMAENQRS
jgi:glutaconate CoA-transferase subunit B